MKSITTGFNIGATLVLSLGWGLWGLFDTTVTAPPLIAQWIDNVWGQLFWAVIVLIFTVLITSKVIQQIWNRLIVDIFQKRPISVNEAYSLFLLAAIFLL